MRPAKPKATLNEQQRKLWQRLNLYITDNDGWITSPPGICHIRFECRPESTLPESLRQAGHDVRDAGTVERLLPTTEMLKENGTNTTITREHVVPARVAIYEFKLPFG